MNIKLKDGDVIEIEFWSFFKLYFISTLVLVVGWFLFLFMLGFFAGLFIL